MADVRIAVIGHGNMGRFHAEYLTQGKVPGAKLGAIVDIDPAVLTEVASLCPSLPLYLSMDELISAKTADAVIVAVPHYFHPPLAIDALNGGLHTLVEKPAGVYTKQVLEMNAVAEKSDKVFAIMFNQRTEPAHQKMRQIIHSGEMGAVKRILYQITDWTRSQVYYDSGSWRATWAGEGGGVLLNQSPHNLDLLQWITGMPTRVRAFCSFGKYHDIEVEDDVTAYLEYASGATGVFMTTTGEAPGSNRFEISGDRGKLVLTGGRLTFYRTTEPVSEYLKTTTEAFGQPETWKCEIPTSVGEGHIGITKNFVDAIVRGTPLLASGLEGINGTTLANAMLLSTWTDSWVNLPIDHEFYYEKLSERIKTSKVKKSSVGRKSFRVDGTF